MIITLVRLLTSGIKPVFFAFPFLQWLQQKTDISGYSGGTVTEFNRVPLTWATKKNMIFIYKIKKSKSIYSLPKKIRLNKRMAGYNSKF